MSENLDIPIATVVTTGNSKQQQDLPPSLCDNRSINYQQQQRNINANSRLQQVKKKYFIYFLKIFIF